jgi:hypothetical protein
LRRGWSGSSLLAPVKDGKIHIRIGGDTKSIGEWARSLGITPEAFSARIRSGWKGDELLLYKQKPRQVHVFLK